jgi:3-hydroxyisobutyrate dehydrogenase-like beta-hydroxyacid dehydrogenase
MSAPAAIGVVGLGNMGGRIARVIVKRGTPVIGLDADPAKAAQAGVEPAASLPGLLDAVEVVLLSLPDSRIVESVVLAAEGILATGHRGQVVVDLSTAAPSSTVALHAQLGERGIDLVDAGISGGAAAAERGTLTIMAGGAEPAFERVRPTLELFATNVHHLGPSGSGHTAKLLNNLLNGVSLAATAEVMVVARRAGLDLHQFLEVVNSSSGVNFATLHRFPRIIEGDYLEGGLTTNLMAKDLMLYLDLARELEVTSLNGPACLGNFHLAAALGYGEQISNRVVDALGDLAGGVRVSDGGGRAG